MILYSPFDLNTIFSLDPDGLDPVSRILRVARVGLCDPGRLREAAAFLVAKLFSRKDVSAKKWQEFLAGVSGCLQRVAAKDEEEIGGESKFFSSSSAWLGSGEKASLYERDIYSPADHSYVWVCKREATSHKAGSWLHDVRRDVSWWRPVATSRGRGGADVHTIRVYRLRGAPRYRALSCSPKRVTEWFPVTASHLAYVA